MGRRSCGFSLLSDRTDLVIAYFHHHRRQWSVILGAPRSGTTYLLKALSAVDGHLGVSSEAFPVAIPSLLNAELSCEAQNTLEASVSASLDAHLAVHETSRALAVADLLQSGIGWREATTGLRRQRTIRGCIYKEPFFSFAPDALFRALPGCQVVHLVRDGRDVADSMVRRYNALTDESLRLGSNELALGRKWDHRWVPWWVRPGDEEAFLACTPYVRAAWLWREMVRRTGAFSMAASSDAFGRVLDVRYEHLVARPLDVGAAILHHLRVPINRRVKKRLLTANQESIGIHHRRDATEVRDATRLIRGELASFGYDG